MRIGPGRRALILRGTDLDDRCDDDLDRLDLHTSRVDVLPFPEQSAGGELFRQRFEFADSGDLVLTGDGLFEAANSVVTGELVDSTQQWLEPDTFREECCGGGEYVWVGHDGGVVIAVNGEHVAAWYPNAEGLTTREITIP